MRQPLLCVTVAAGTVEELRRKRDAADNADLVELRLDHLDVPDGPAALDGRRRPVIVTCRPTWEGGRFDGPEEDRRRVLEGAVAAGAEFVDIEAAAAFAPEIIRMRRGRGVVLSAHLHGEAPTDLQARAAAMRSTGAEVIKIAIEAHGVSDVLPLFALADRSPAHEVSGHVFIAMGTPGLASRVLAGRLRNRWTYAGDGVAPGQIPAARLLDEFHFRRIAPDAALYGVVGHPVGHSRSPAMHNAGFAAMGMNAVYLPFEAASADDFVRFARSLKISGVSITAPFKVALMSHVDRVEPLARRVGAINTIVVRDGCWIGANTDVHGFLAPLSGRIGLKGTRAAVLGAGGAARGVAIALADRGAAVTICARKKEAAREIAELVGGQVGSFPPKSGTWDILINATPAGTGPGGVNPIAGAPLDGEMVFDLVYTPAETPLLADARAAGCLTIGGLEMLVAQAERQFELWTGHQPPAGLFARAAGVKPGSDQGQTGVRRGSDHRSSR
ncbi:MAG: shikimate dehydrogenase [Vicinamibacterales bacterium]